MSATENELSKQTATTEQITSEPAESGHAAVDPAVKTTESAEAGTETASSEVATAGQAMPIGGNSVESDNGNLMKKRSLSELTRSGPDEWYPVSDEVLRDKGAISEQEFRRRHPEAAASPQARAGQQDVKAGTGTDKSGKSIYVLLEEEIMGLDISDAEKAKRLSRLIKVRSQKVNIMLAGATGAGKSSTINALFNTDVAKVGVGVDPETSYIEKYELDNLTVWDTPGLGDGVASDEKIKRIILEKLSELDKAGRPLIDLVVVIIDASSKDLGTSYDLINNILIPAMGSDADGRILLALNQADVAMKGAHWNKEENAPDDVLKEFLRKKVDSVQDRVKEATGLNIRPIYYCAGYKEAGGEQHKPYNLTKLLYYIIKAVPKRKRLALADSINSEEDNWLHDDAEKDYKKDIKDSFGDTIWYCIGEGLGAGGQIGEDILGIPGKIVGCVIGAAAGAVKGVYTAIFN